MEKAEEKKNKEKPGEEPKAKSSSGLLIFLLITIFAVAAYLLIWPEYGRLVFARAEIVSQKQALQDESRIFSDINKLLKNYGEISSGDKEKIEAMLPNEIDEAGLFTLFEFLAKKNKIIVLGVDISEKESTEILKNSGVMEIQASLNLTAGPDAEDSYGDFKKFLADLEANLRLMDIVSINYTPETATYAMNLKTYRMTAAEGSAGQITP